MNERTNGVERAALYVRASTEHQNYSTQHQIAALRVYAAEKHYAIARIYEDDGRSGLTLEGRLGLMRLLLDVQEGTADFTIILVYDVSRWGRFQDIDESAHYEYACRKAGISIMYCAEPFSNDGSPLAAMLKSLKRAMAAEFSRELSSKVFSAQCRLTLAGYKQGGMAGYGLRRLAISSSGTAKGILAQGEYKNFPTDRVIHTLGPDAEIAIVRRIYDLYLRKSMTHQGIARLLNSEGVEHSPGRCWTDYHVLSILSNEKYCGTLVFNRSTQRMKSPRRPIEQEKWVTLPDAFDAIVSRETFELAAVERRLRRKIWSDGEMLDGLRDLFVEHGRVDAVLIDGAALPSAKSYAFRFQGLVAALDAAGVAASSVPRTILTRSRIQKITKETISEFERCAIAAGANLEKLSPRTFGVNGVVARILVTRCRYERSHRCWNLDLLHSPAVDFMIWVRMDQGNEFPQQYYLVPKADFPDQQYLWPSTRTLQRYDRYSRPSIKHMFGLA